MLDPLGFCNIPEVIQGFIMKHFNGKDLLVMSEVSKSWNNLVKTEIPKKTILNLSKKKAKSEDIEILAKIGTTFKEIVMYSEAFNNIPVSLFADTVEKLKIINDINVNLKQPVYFLKLKSLDIHLNTKGENYKWISQLRISELEELKISNLCGGYPECEFCCIDADSGNFHSFWMEFFYNIKGLKRMDLGICGNDMSLVLLNQTRQLESLRFQQSLYSDVSDIVSFMKTLKNLTVIEPEDLSFVFKNGLMELTTLNLEKYSNHSSSFEVDENSVKHTIKHLSIKTDMSFGFNSQRFNRNVKKLLNAFPELETFYVTKLTSELMKFIADTNWKMKTVKFSVIEEGTLEEYEQMRQTQALNINRDIQFIKEF